jgi:hypothetical protein
MAFDVREKVTENVKGSVTLHPIGILCSMESNCIAALTQKQPPNLKLGSTHQQGELWGCES